MYGTFSCVRLDTELYPVLLAILSQISIFAIVSQFEAANNLLQCKIITRQPFHMPYKFI